VIFLRGLQPGRAIPLLAVLLEVLWIYPWFLLVGEWEVLGWIEPPLALGSAVVLAVVAEALSNRSLTRNWAQGRTYLLVLPALVMLLAAVIRVDVGSGYAIWDFGWTQYALEHPSPIYGGLALGTLLFWRGISAGRDDHSFDDFYRKFLMGLIALVILLALRSSVTGASEVATSTGFYVLGFFSIGLMSLGLINLQSIREEMLRREESSGVQDQRWIPMLLGVVFIILTVSLVTASAFSFSLATLLLQPLSVLAGWMVIVLIYTVALPVGVVAAGLIYVLRFLASLVGRGEPPGPIILPGPGEISRVVDGQDSRGIPPELLLAFKWIMVILLVLLVLFILARALRRYWKGRGEEEGMEEISESLWSWKGFKSDLRSYLSRLLSRLKKQRPEMLSVAPVPIAVSEDGALGRMLTVREIYQGVLSEGRRVGLPRRQPETPYEYQGRLQVGFPPGGPELQAITEAYAAQRYGRENIADEQLGRLNQLWRHLFQVFRDTAAEDDNN
jgi:hypothetical protein